MNKCNMCNRAWDVLHEEKLWCRGCWEEEKKRRERRSEWLDRYIAGLNLSPWQSAYLRERMI